LFLPLLTSAVMRAEETGSVGRVCGRQAEAMFALPIDRRRELR